jgi:Zn-dependent M16 (insulinase) family peptidase
MAGTNRLSLIGSVKLGLLRSEASMYVDVKSSMRVVICNIPGPLCQADIILPTECFDNKGLPHCLEHLIFMGSEKYPERGFLDKLANLCVAQGTNAWTDRDHTAYSAVTAGKEGLIRLLPVFLDHVLRPTLTDLQFQTEIYHVDGEGKQGGVVFCEMQARTGYFMTVT